MTKKIRLAIDSGSDRFVAEVRALPDAARFEIVDYVGKGEEALGGLVADVDAIYIYQHRLSAELIDAAPSLRFIQKHGLNCKNIDLDAARARAIPVATIPLVRNALVAEQAMALMLACARKVVQGHDAVIRGVYREMGIEPVLTGQRDHRPNWPNIADIVELTGESVGIIGLGDIGMEIARRCRAFDMDVFYHQRQRHTPDIEAMFEARYLPFEELLSTVSYLVLVLPHTPETEGMIGARQLALMKPTSTLINVARGAIVDEAALAEALANRRIAMAGLDVFRWEPLPVTSPLLGLSNVVLTPHMGGGTRSARTRDRAAGLANILRFFDEGKPRGVVNP